MINLRNESASHADSHGSVDESDESKMNSVRVCIGYVLRACVLNACLFECENRAGFPPQINALCRLLVADSYQ